MPWNIRRVDALPALPVTDTIYFVQNADDNTIADQYVIGNDGQPRLIGASGGGATITPGPGFALVGAELRYAISTLTRA